MHRLFIKGALALFLVLCADMAHAQLREFEITPVQNNRIPVFRDHPEMAAVIVNSSLTNLQFDSNLEVVAVLGDASQGEYILIVRPVRQILSVRVPGFQQGRMQITMNAPRQVVYFQIEPKDRLITDRGNLIVRTEPAGALVSIDGIPGEFNTPYMFENLIAITQLVRIRLDGYQSEERMVRIEGGRTIIEEFRVSPTVGFVELMVPESELYVALEGEIGKNRVISEPGKPIRLDPGMYSYRLEKPFYRPAEGVMEIVAGREYILNPTLSPNFSTLRVRANAPSIELSSAENRAPESTIAGTIYLEPGQREVVVAASGFAPTRIRIRSVAGASRDTMVTLLTQADADEIARRNALPRGILKLAADVDAEIYVNGNREGKMQAELTLAPGTYDVEFRHPLKRERLSVDVISADLVIRQVSLRPAKSRALLAASLLPGAGHMYTKQRRGYVYLGATVAGLAFSWLQNDAVNSKTSEYNQAFRQYQSAGSVEEAALYKAASERARLNANQATRMLTYGLAATAGIYLIQLADIQFSSPRYGYRSKMPAFELGVAPFGLQLTYRLP